MEMRRLFLDCADVVADALSDSAVEEHWGDKSTLEDQTIGVLAAHLSRAVFTAGTYLDGESPEGPLTFENVAAYYSILTDQIDQAGHAAIRERSAEVAAVGPSELAKQVSSEIERLRPLLLAEPSDRVLAVFGGSMNLDDYLGTRIVEQVVHLDDLAQSLGIQPWVLPQGSEALVIACGAEIGRRRLGGPAMIRTLFRGQGSVLRVI